MNQQFSNHSFFAYGLRCLMILSLVCATCLFGAQQRPVAAQAEVLGANPARPKAATDDTMIAYNKNSNELHLIQPDGGNHRMIWRIPEGAPGAIESIAWRPDAQQIAFASSHEATCSVWSTDIYLINPDGSNLRRLTNGPACAELAQYPQGSASVQIDNQLAGVSQLLVYIEGAPTAQVVTVAPGNTVLVAFPQVADFGANVPQNVVAINGGTRWFDAAVTADITPGQNAHAGKLTLNSSGFTAFGAAHISWNPEGTKLAFQFGTGRLWQIGLNAPSLNGGGPLLNPQTNNAILGSQPVWSPIDNQVLYERFDTSPFTVARTEVDSNDPGTPLGKVTLTRGIAWLTDGAGFVVADEDALLAHADLYLMKFADNSITQLTQTTGHQAALYPKVAADSSQLVYTYVPDLQADPVIPQVRIMNVDGSNDHLLADNGFQSDWSRRAPQVPTATATPQDQPTATATATQPTQPTATTTPQEQATPGVTPTPGNASSYRVFLPNVKR